MSEAVQRRGIGRPRSIDRDKIVAAAHRLGTENLTMRAIAEHLGVTTQALYNHIGGRRELLQLLANDHGELFAVTAQAETATWQEWLRTFAVNLRRHLADQPGLATSVITQGPTTEAALRFVERTVHKMVEGGFTPATALRCYRILVEFVVGWSQCHDQPQSAVPLVGPPEALAESGASSQLWNDVESAWSTDVDELFDFGLRCLLDGLAQRSEGREPAR